MKKIVKILDISDVARSVKRLITTKPDGYVFTPGQATDIAISKPGYTRQKHPFTFTGLNSDNYLEFTIKIYPLNEFSNHSGATEKIGQLSAGDELIIGEPFGTISYEGEGIFIAGGAGITPFVAIFRQLVSEGKIGDNKLIYSNKQVEDIIYESELREIFGENIILTLTGKMTSGYEYGRINYEFLKKHISDYSCKFYICGPMRMVSDLRQDLASLGADVKSIIFEK